MAYTHTRRALRLYRVTGVDTYAYEEGASLKKYNTVLAAFTLTSIIIEPRFPFRRNFSAQRARGVAEKGANGYAALEARYYRIAI